MLFKAVACRQEGRKWGWRFAVTAGSPGHQIAQLFGYGTGSGLTLSPLRRLSQQWFGGLWNNPGLGSVLESPTEVRRTDCAGLVLTWGLSGFLVRCSRPHAELGECESWTSGGWYALPWGVVPAGGQSPSGSRSIRRGLWSGAGMAAVSMRLWGPAQRSWASSAGRLWTSPAALGHAARTTRVPLAQGCACAQVSCVAQAAQRVRQAARPPGPGQRPGPAPGRSVLPSYSPVSIRGLSAPSSLGTRKCLVEAERRTRLCFTYLLTPSLLCGFFSTMSNSRSAAFTFPKSSKVKLAYVNSFHCSFSDPETARRLSRLILTLVLAKPRAPTAEVGIAQVSGACPTRARAAAAPGGGVRTASPRAAAGRQRLCRAEELVLLYHQDF